MSFMPIDWTAVSALTNLLKLIKESVKKKPIVGKLAKKKEVTAEKSKDSYQVALGKKHQYLREEVLKINKRAMADFYDFEKVKHLEDCEAGLDEFPRVSMERLEDFFFINKSFIEESSERIFQNFPLIYTQEGCRLLLDKGFKPYILTKPKPVKGDRFAHILFYKKEAGFDRMVVSNGYGNFDSNGGGKDNIKNLIRALADINEYSCTVDVYHVTSKRDWQDLEQGNYYNKGMCGLAGCADNRCYDVFQKWFREFVDSRKKLEG